MVKGFIDDCVLDEKIIRALALENKFLPKECELWDYKSKHEESDYDYAMTVKRILSFHNSYGGYLIFGIHEREDEKLFLPASEEAIKIDIKKLKGRIDKFLSSPIDITYNDVTADFEESTYHFGILHIPKRRKEDHVVSIKRKGPEDLKKKPVFNCDEVYYRKKDTCIKANKAEDWKFLLSERDHCSFNDGLNLQKSVANLEHNLPDKNFICPKFFGRENIIEHLWQWLGDEFQYSKVLAGDGGKGKTSIAYEFAKEVSKIGARGFEYVIWLTAKKKQFIGHYNRYIDVPSTHFSDANSLLEAIALNLGYFEDELTDINYNAKIREVKNAIEVNPSLIIVDDIDSTEPDEQKKILELARAIGDQKTKFLLTTRINLTYSSDLCITVPGLEPPFFDDYVKYIAEKIGYRIPSKFKFSQFRKDTGGSPLMVESIFRLVQQGMDFEKAVKEWKEKAGEDVRNAALKKEISSLSPESKRVLFAASYLRDSSLSELIDATGYQNVQMVDLLQELQSLFMIESPRFIETEQRFEVSENTILTVMNMKADLANDFAKIIHSIREIEKAQSIKGKKITVIGKAISQANSLLKKNQVNEAIQTIDSLLSVKKHKNNADLLLMKARCVMENENPDLNESRQLFQKSYQNGQRKEILFRLWYEAEKAAKHNQGIINVCTIAIDEGVGDQNYWLVIRASVHWNIAFNYKDSDLIKYLEIASNDLSVAIKNSKGEERKNICEHYFMINDEIWGKTKTIKGINEVGMIRVAVSLIRKGDYRALNYHRILDYIDTLVAKSKEEFLVSPLKYKKTTITINNQFKTYYSLYNADDRALNNNNIRRRTDGIKKIIKEA